ncbi:MAG TPA: alkaline phosphatase family protein [Dehalococcoidia bacterium]|nr:alkaline phosphatase family protein [Dehalococcoidia bacterium]
MTNQTIVIGLDGATFTILDRLMDEGVMPFLKGFTRAGARADLRSVIPALTPPAWTSLMTGRSPGNHGVFDFFRPVAPGSRQIRYTTSHDIACETIWSMASRQGLRVTTLNFPLMFPPPAINGHVVPGGWVPWRQLRLGCYPSDLYDRLKALPGFNARELAMDPALERKAIEGCGQDEYAEWVELHIRREQHWFEILRYLMAEEPAELTAVLFDGVDKLQHLCWRFLDVECLGQSPAPWELKVRELCLEYFRQLDGLLAEIAAMADRDATIVIASDHGFGHADKIFYVNAWLEQNGYLAWAEAPALDTQGTELLGIGEFARHVYQMDWTKTKAYAATPSSNGIHIVAGEGGGVAPAEYGAFRARLIEALLRLRDGASGEPVVQQVWTRQEAYPGPLEELGPDLTLSLRDGANISVLAAETAVQGRREIRGTHRPEGVFIARGRGIRAGLSLPELSIMDVTPLVLYSLGLPIPADMEGRLPEEALEEAALRERPAASAAAGQVRSNDPQAGGEGVFSAEDEKVMAERLRALGYIE